ncbi:nucleoside-diphosphate sugar epimerase [Streptomyces sp. Act143]|uniref:SDR family oxidoreductase n=1 Tax=Streptomyces sp. Act143 TaxID=2200760 RepID=UPI000D67A10D|nr:NAD(P)H-binding protein [Streptomyces sp. Act143]PWI17033.1 nucleoside-diphosphate sugar epimerase [Streptomyces sp. Act143]
MILVTGATGHVGGELVRRLAASGTPVRAMTRRPDAARFPAGAAAVYGDAQDPASLTAAFAGVSAAFLMSAQPVGAAPVPTHDLALAEAARGAGVRRLVKLSVLDGGAGSDPIARWHAAAEAAVVAAAPAWTLLRPGRFMSNALQWAGQLRSGDEVAIPFADRPAASIDPADLAEIAALALTTDEHTGMTYELSGPESLTPAQELSLLGRLLGRDLRLRPVPPEAARAGMERYGFPAEVVDAIMRRTLEDGRGADVLPTAAEALGRPPRTFTQWARAHAAAFR